jgi:hypothetical protein
MAEHESRVQSQGQQALHSKRRASGEEQIHPAAELQKTTEQQVKDKRRCRIKNYHLINTQMQFTHEVEILTAKFIAIRKIICKSII